MTIHFGDVSADRVLYIPFASYGANGESITLTGLAVTDIEIFKDGSTTQRSSDAGYSLLDTDGIDFDGITGIHGFLIDLQDNTDAGFFAVGSFYWVIVSAVTINAQTVNFIAATFRISAMEGVTGFPKVDIGAVRGDEQSAIDLKDFADAGYDPATNKVQGVVLVDTVTTLTNLPTIPNNWLTAAGIAAAALNGKGDWNIGKTGYTLTQAFPTNFADLAITVTTGRVTVGTNADKTGYSLSSTQTFDVTGNITGNLSGSVGSVSGAVGSVTGAVGSVTGSVGSVTGAINTAAGTITTLDALDTAQDTQHTTTHNRLPAALVGGRIDATVDATGMEAGAITAILTTAMTEAYAADGAAPTLAQALFLIQQSLTEFVISGTTLTIKKIDGSTTAATLTLNDATTPTGVTRAT
jgi:hypothetical protein